jgi:uncharacterized radical SAM superfamily Fe-S cluster-containing enzyme
MELPSQTESLCPYCLQRVAARRIVENDSVYLVKSCPEHGDLGSALLWRNHPRTYGEWRRTRAGSTEDPDRDLRSGGSTAPVSADGCPYRCGLCPHHQQSTCTAILEVTRRCNIRCPVCFAASEPGAFEDPEITQVEQMLQTVKDCAGICPIQLSGGEPTLRDDLPQIIRLARKAGFDHIQVNTNGIRIGQDIDYARALKDAGVSDIFLQFDGLTENTYIRLRGTGLLPLKIKAIEFCEELKIGVILVPTLVRSVNEMQIGAIIRFAKKWMPTVRGVHFQPMAYLGRHPEPPRNEDRILVPDILAAIEEQTGGELKAEDFVPPG